MKQLVTRDVQSRGQIMEKNFKYKNEIMDMEKKLKDKELKQKEEKRNKYYERLFLQQPRRVAAMSVAKRVSEERGCK